MTDTDDNKVPNNDGGNRKDTGYIGGQDSTSEGDV